MVKSEPQSDRILWLEHVLRDPDARRFYSHAQLVQFNEEREFLEEKKKDQHRCRLAHLLGRNDK